MIYLDSCLVIYLVEQHTQWGERVARLIEGETRFDFAISPLVKCECLVGPLKSGNAILREDYLDVFSEFASIDMSEPVYLRAAELRARFGIKLPDALHLACAQQHRCEELWTNDGRLTRLSAGMARNILSPSVR